MSDFSKEATFVTITRQAQEIERLQARLAEAERDAARYRFIKQWARRLDITGYSLTNNEHFEPRIDEAMQLRPADSADEVPCHTCQTPALCRKLHANDIWPVGCTAVTVKGEP